MSFKKSLMLTIFASLALGACDSVKFPGFTEAEDTASAPSQTGPAPQDSVSTIPATEPIPETPATETSAGEAEPVADENSASVDNEPETVQEVSEYAGIDNLLAINAARCAPSSEETMTLAEIANADVVAATVAPQAVNGTEITTDSFPGIVKMEPRRILASGSVSSGHCGATRIANNWFITASHCLDDTYDEIRLIATESSLKDPRALVFEATASLCHSAYGGASGQYSNDVALIGVSDETAATLTDVPIARFGATDRALVPVNYPNARMAGWGLTSFDRGELSNTLLQADLNLVSSGPAAITVSSTENSGPCIGDSGGPLLIDEADGGSKVIGVLSVVEQNRSTGKFCSGDYNARYTNLAGYLDWIEATIGVCTENPELCSR